MGLSITTESAGLIELSSWWVAFLLCFSLSLKIKSTTNDEIKNWLSENMSKICWINFGDLWMYDSNHSNKAHIKWNYFFQITLKKIQNKYCLMLLFGLFVKHNFISCIVLTHFLLTISIYQNFVSLWSIFSYCISKTMFIFSFSVLINSNTTISKRLWQTITYN